MAGLGSKMGLTWSITIVAEFNVWVLMECWPLGGLGKCHQETLKNFLLKLNLEAVLSENFEALNFMVGATFCLCSKYCMYTCIYIYKI